VKRNLDQRRREARGLFLSGETSSNAEIAERIQVKPHTVGRWRKVEDWDGLRLKIDRRAGEMFVERIATDRVTMNEHHYKLWAVILARLTEDFKARRELDIRDMERVSAMVDRAQKGQRLARGMSIAGETEQAIRAEAEAENRRLIDSFIDAIKTNVEDEETRERIRQTLLAALPAEEDDGTGDGEDAVAH
jgi:hypothetical protein